MPTHIIKCQTWVLCLSSQQSSWAIKNTVSQLARTQLPPMLARLCDQQAETDRLYSLDRIELDLGVIELSQWEQPFIEKVVAAFARALAEQLYVAKQQQAVSNVGRPKVIERDKNAQALRAVDHFIKTGTRPWWAPRDGMTLAQCLSRLIDHAPAMLREKLGHYLRQAPYLQRLIGQFSDNQLLALSRLLALAREDNLSVWCQQINVPLRRAVARGCFTSMALRTPYWQAILITCDTMSRMTVDKVAFFKQVLLHLATHYQLNYCYLLVSIVTTLTPREKAVDPWQTLLHSLQNQQSSPSTPERNDVNDFISDSIYEQLLTQLQSLRDFCTAKNKKPFLPHTHMRVPDVARQTGLISKVDCLIDIITANKKNFSEHHQTLGEEFDRFKAYLSRMTPQLWIPSSEMLAHLPYHCLVTLQQTLKELDACPLMRRHHALIHSIMNQIKPSVSSQATLRHQEGKVAALLPLLRQLLSRLQQEIVQAAHQSTPSKIVGTARHTLLSQGVRPIQSITVTGCEMGQSGQRQKSKIALLIPQGEKASSSDLPWEISRTYSSSVCRQHREESQPTTTVIARQQVRQLRKRYGRLCRQYQALLTLTGQASTVRVAKPDVANPTLGTSSLQSVTAMINTLSAVLKKQRQLHQRSQVSTSTTPQPRLLEREDDEDRREDIYIDNAGLILLGEYLNPFFTAAHLLQDDHFIDHAVACRAALLLQYLIAPQSTFFESALTFNKLLCGLDLHEPIERTFIVNVVEQSACHHLFQMIKVKWSVMARMSNDYFIKHFLLRQGVVRDSGHHWQLHVKRTTHDVLMKGFSWPTSLIQLPWLDKPIQVDW